MQKILSKKEIRKLLPDRRKDVCKTDFGHILILAGSRGMTGAGVLCGLGALRSGAGLVTIGCAESLIDILASQEAELMTLPLPETEEQTLSSNAFEPIKDFVERRKVSVLAIGPGLSTHVETVKLVQSILFPQNLDRFSEQAFFSLPIVLDADGLNALQGEVPGEKLQVKSLKESKARIIVTPHPGEFARLINEAKKKIQKNRDVYAKNFAKENNVVCVLKGYHTVVTDGNEVFVNPTGNPGMATAGCGDVLTGMIAGLIPQITNVKLKMQNAKLQIQEILFKATKLAVYLHGLAGDLAAKEKTEIGLIARDIIEKIPQAIKAVKGVR